MNDLTAPSNDRNWTFRCSGVSPDATIQPNFPSRQLMGPFRASVGSLGHSPGAHMSTGLARGHVSTGLARGQHVQVNFDHWALSKMTVCHCLLRSQNTQEMVHSLGIAQGSTPTSLLPSSKGVSQSFGESALPVSLKEPPALQRADNGQTKGILQSKEEQRLLQGTDEPEAPGHPASWPHAGIESHSEGRGKEWPDLGFASLGSRVEGHGL